MSFPKFWHCERTGKQTIGRLRKQEKSATLLRGADVTGCLQAGPTICRDRAHGSPRHQSWQYIYLMRNEAEEERDYNLEEEIRPGNKRLWKWQSSLRSLWIPGFSSWKNSRIPPHSMDSEVCKSRWAPSGQRPCTQGRLPLFSSTLGSGLWSPWDRSAVLKHNTVYSQASIKPWRKVPK